MSGKKLVDSSEYLPDAQALFEETFVLSEEQEKELEGLYKEVGRHFRAGTLVPGYVVSNNENGVLISINYKSDGLVPSYEFTEFELKRLNSGDPIEVLLDRLEDENGTVVLSYQKAKSLKAWDRIAQLASEDKPVTGVVTHKVKGGLSVDIGTQAFLPGSQVDIQRVQNFDQFVGQEVTCKILKVNPKRGNIILSRRKYLEEQRLEDKKRALDTLHEGEVIQGTVKNITNYGVFVDIGGIDGLLHITDMSWGRIAHPGELVRLGDLVTVKVLSFDKQHEKISLGMKQLQQNPWEGIAAQYPIASVVKGRISSIADYGLFIEIARGVEGLVHISEVSWTERVHNLSKHFTVGQELTVKVVALDVNNRRMSLSIKQLSGDPWKVVTEKFKVGQKISGKVNNITDFGLFVQLCEGVDGLVHISDISWTEHVVHPSDKFKRGDIVEAVILFIDAENKRVSLGIKQLTQDPWENIEELFPQDSIVTGTVSKITPFGAFVRLPRGVEGLVHKTEVTNKEIEKVEDVLSVGQEEKFKVIRSNKEERRLGLSLRAVKEPEETVRNIEMQKAYASHEESNRFSRTSSESHVAPRKEREPKKVSAPQKQPELMKNSLQQALESREEKLREQSEKEQD